MVIIVAGFGELLGDVIILGVASKMIGNMGNNNNNNSNSNGNHSNSNGNSTHNHVNRNNSNSNKRRIAKGKDSHKRPTRRSIYEGTRYSNPF
jgi:hypothetical protein